MPPSVRFGDRGRPTILGILLRDELHIPVHWPPRLPKGLHGSYPIIGVNAFRSPHEDSVPRKLELIRSTEEEKRSQLQRLADFHERHSKESGPMLKRLQQTVMDDGNVFAVLMDAVRCCSLGQITHALFEVGGQYRRNM